MQPSILVVDDSALARTAAIQRLRAQGVGVTALASTQEAACLDLSGFAAALLDIDLGDGWGTDIAERLRQGAPGIPVAFLTAQTPEALLDGARRLGPVFSKNGGVEEAIAWIVEAARAVHPIGT